MSGGRRDTVHAGVGSALAARPADPEGLAPEAATAAGAQRRAMHAER